MAASTIAQKSSVIGNFLSIFRRSGDPLSYEIGTIGLKKIESDLIESGIRVSQINNRRYLGSKNGLTGFIREAVEQNCPGISSVIDIFSGTGAVANAFIDKAIITNDILYSNYLSNICWFSPEQYRPFVIIDAIAYLNTIETTENNYVRRNFADTYFSANNSSKIGAARELIEQVHVAKLLNEREFAILVTSVLYGMDRIANTVGHYDAYRKGASLDRTLVFPVLLPAVELSKHNKCYNSDSNELIGMIKGDLLYCDPPYNSRQYSDAYHLLENIARWDEPEVYGIARKMDRSGLKSVYNTVSATEAFRNLVVKADVKYIIFSYNNMAAKGNGRSNAKMKDEDIMAILSEKGTVRVLEQPYKAFSAGKSSIVGNSERLFICTVKSKAKPIEASVRSPINYIGGKGKLMSQLRSFLPSSSLFVDLFAGGCTVGANVQSEKVVFNDKNRQLMNLVEFLSSKDPKEIIDAADAVISSYGFSDTYRYSYAHYGAESSSGLAAINRGPFLRLRDTYNQEPASSRDPLLLYLLVIFSFNNQLRFNSKGDFNLPVGKRDYNASMRNKLSVFHSRMSRVNSIFQVGDFREFDINSTPTDTLFYCDPPYLITQATYNENGGWTERDEWALLGFLERVHASGRRFALSNVLEAKGATNKILHDWVNETGFTMYNLNMSYRNSNYHRAKRSSMTLEVLITNYQGDR